MEKLKIADQNLENAENEMLTALDESYPKGAYVQFIIMHGQVNPSTGTVVSHDPKLRTVRVRHHQAKEDSRYACRNIHYKYII